MRNPADGDLSGKKKSSGIMSLPLHVPVEAEPALQMPRQDVLRARLGELRLAHRKLHDKVSELAAQGGFASLALQRLKREKLGLKDAISRIEDELTPDIIA